MGLSKKNVWVGKPDQSTTGAIFSGATGAVGEVTDLSTLEKAISSFKSSGYISGDGLEISINKDFEEIKDWSQETVRKIKTGYSGEFKWKHIGLDEQAWKNFAGEKNVKITKGKGVVTFNSDDPEIKTFVFKVKDGDRKLAVVVPEALVQGDGGFNFKGNEAIGLPIILTTLPDAKGNHFYIFYEGGDAEVV